MSLLAICFSSLSTTIKIPCPFLKLGYLSFYWCVVRILYLFWTIDLTRHMTWLFWGLHGSRCDV